LIALSFSTASTLSTSPPGSTTTPVLVVHVEQDGAILLERCDRHDAGIELTHDRPFAWMSVNLR
jgi:hypothetical protein